MTPLVYILESTDPYQNLAIEDYLFRNVSEDQYILIFYSNSSSLVLGHFQDPWKEVNFPLLNEKKISLVRRQSGGGAVFHDEQNINFCFISSEKKFDQSMHIKILKDYLDSHSLKLEVGENSSLFISGYKFSGSAFKNIKGRKLHHGTLLVQGDSEFITNLLTPNNFVIKSKSTNSTKSNIRPLKEWSSRISKQDIIQSIASLFCQKFNSEFKPSILDLLSNNTLAHLNNMSARLRSSDWIYGVTPLSIFDNEKTNLRYHIEKGKLTKVLYNKEELWKGEVSLDSIYTCEELVGVVSKKEALSIDRALYEIIS